MAIDVNALTIAQARDAFRRKEYSAKELTEAVVAQAKKENPSINAYAEIFDDALAQAEHADKLLQEGKGGDLTGIPLAVKDNMLIKGRISASGSKILMDHRAVYDATVVTKLKEQGEIGRASGR